MKAFLIDPFEMKVTEVDHNGDFHQIYEFIDARTFDVVRIPYNDSIYVDDDGLYKSNQRFFIHKDYGYPLAGKALVLGTDGHTGDSADSKTTLEELKSKVQFGDPINVMGRIMWVPAQ